jgi:hypothetical protein
VDGLDPAARVLLFWVSILKAWMPKSIPGEGREDERE